MVVSRLSAFALGLLLVAGCAARADEEVQDETTESSEDEVNRVCATFVTISPGLDAVQDVNANKAARAIRGLRFVAGKSGPWTTQAIQDFYAAPPGELVLKGKLNWSLGTPYFDVQEAWRSVSHTPVDRQAAFHFASFENLSEIKSDCMGDCSLVNAYSISKLNQGFLDCTGIAAEFSWFRDIDASHVTPAAMTPAQLSSAMEHERFLVAGQAAGAPTAADEADQVEGTFQASDVFVLVN